MPPCSQARPRCCWMGDGAVRLLLLQPAYSFHLEKPVPPPPLHGQHQKPSAPQPGTYVEQVPKNKVFCMRPPENERLFQHYTRLAKRRAGCSCLRADVDLQRGGPAQGR